MNARQMGIGSVLAPFLALTGYAVYHHGYLAFFDFHALNAVQLQIVVDLIIALSFVMVWMWRDAKARGISPIPYVVMTVLLGSIGPLVYVIRREATDTSSVGVPAAAR